MPKWAKVGFRFGLRALLAGAVLWLIAVVAAARAFGKTPL